MSIFYRNDLATKSQLLTKSDLVAGKVPASQLPSYVDDVLEVANLAALPATGETGKIYITIDTGLIYRWSGSVFVNIPTTPAQWTEISVSDNTVVFPSITNNSEIKITLVNTDGQPTQEIYFYGSFLIESDVIVGITFLLWDADSGSPINFILTFNSATKTITFNNIPALTDILFFHR